MTLPDRFLDRYEIVSSIGRGGMGEVYRARDLRLGREVALKLLPPRFTVEGDALARFGLEARALAALNHPNVVTIHDYGTDHGSSFTVTELLEGETLRSRLERGPLPWREAASIAGAVAEGLAAAHARGVVHRDLKPENIFLTAGGGVKVLDFGLALWERPPRPDPDSEPTSPLEHGVLVGTVSYMSPEQARRSGVDARSDIFSMGCVLHEMVTGRPLYAHASGTDTLAAILRDPPPDLEREAPGLPPGLQAAIRRCLEKDPDDRFQSAQDLAFALRMLSGTSGASLPLPPGRRRPLRLAGGVLAAAATAALAAHLLRGGGEAIESLAVLPFRHTTADPEAEYLTEGITESLINGLSRMPGLRVMARSTVFRYQGDQDPIRAGRDLKVKAVLTGTVSRRGERLAVQADLVRVSDGTQLWGERYERPLAELPALPDEIAQRISETLRMRLGERRGPRNARPVDVQAYQATLRGRFHWNKRTAEGLRKAVESFQEAIERDPSHAPAFAGLADAYSMMATYSVLPPREAVPRAKAAARRALELDESLAEAHTSLAYALYSYDWDWAAAEREFRRALELNPGYAPAHQWFAHMLAATGRLEQARARVVRAQELDPLSLIINSNVGTMLYYSRRHDEAVEQLRRTIDMDGGFATARVIIAWPYLARGSFAEAIAESERAVTLSRGSPPSLSILAESYARGGRADDARRVLEELRRLREQRYVSPYDVARVHAALGETDPAFAELDRACEERPGPLIFVGIDPASDGLRGDPRFTAVLSRLGLPERLVVRGP